VLQVRILEKSGVFQTETEHTVQAQVRQANQSDRSELRRGQQQGNQQKRHRASIRVNEIVESRAPPGVDQITQHE
jgi:hypothetical protein